MKQEQFDKLVQERLDLIKSTLLIKSKEYVRNNDPLHNFNQGSQMTGQLSTDVLQGFLLKHLVSYNDMLDDLRNDKIPTREYVREKLGDILVYFILQEIQILDRIDLEVFSKRLKEKLVCENKNYISNTDNNFDNITTTLKTDIPLTFTQ